MYVVCFAQVAFGKCRRVVVNTIREGQFEKCNLGVAGTTLLLSDGCLISPRRGEIDVCVGAGMKGRKEFGQIVLDLFRR